MLMANTPGSLTVDIDIQYLKWKEKKGSVTC